MHPSGASPRRSRPHHAHSTIAARRAEFGPSTAPTGRPRIAHPSRAGAPRARHRFALDALSAPARSGLHTKPEAKRVSIGERKALRARPLRSAHKTGGQASQHRRAETAARQPLPHPAPFAPVETEETEIDKPPNFLRAVSPHPSTKSQVNLNLFSPVSPSADSPLARAGDDSKARPAGKAGQSPAGRTSLQPRRSSRRRRTHRIATLPSS